jgi:hypothetical protein
MFFLKHSRSATHSFKRAIALTASVPILVVVYFLLKYMNRRLRQSMDGDIRLTTTNYKRMWNGYVNFDETTQVLKKIAGISVHPIPWYARGIVAQLVVISKNIINLHSKISQKIESLDTPYCKLPDGVRVVTTEELWKNRVKTYDFLI